MPKITIGNKRLSEFEVEKIMRMIYANKAKNELIELNYFSKILPKEDSDYLKRLCAFDFTKIPDKSSKKWIDWDIAMNVLCDLSRYIFEIHHNQSISSYSMDYSEHYTIEDRIKKWSEVKHKDDAKRDKLVDELIESFKNEEE